MVSFMMIVLGFVVGAIRAGAVYFLWGWFITPTFHIAVPAFVMLWGVLVLISVVIHNGKGMLREDIPEYLLNSFVHSLVALGVGAVLVTFA